MQILWSSNLQDTKDFSCEYIVKNSPSAPKLRPWLTFNIELLTYLTYLICPFRTDQIIRPSPGILMLVCLVCIFGTFHMSSCFPSLLWLLVIFFVRPRTYWCPLHCYPWDLHVGPIHSTTCPTQWHFLLWFYLSWNIMVLVHERLFISACVFADFH